MNDEDPSQGIDPTKQALVTIDAGPPTSSVSPLPATEASPSFTVSWSGAGRPGRLRHRLLQHLRLRRRRAVHALADRHARRPRPRSPASTATPTASTAWPPTTSATQESPPAQAQAATFVQVPTLTNVTSDYSSGSVYGQIVTFTATVTPTSSFAMPPTGSVQFQIDGTDYGNPVPLSDGSASISDAAFTPGNYTVSAFYSGDSNYVGSHGTLSGGQAVAQAPLSVTVNNQTKVYWLCATDTHGHSEGVVNGDNITVTYSTTATMTSDVVSGGYPITATLVDPDGRLNNYTVTNTPGTLTITQANQTITWSNPANIVFGTLLSNTQLDASVSVVGPATAGALTYLRPPAQFSRPALTRP